MVDRFFALLSAMALAFLLSGSLEALASGSFAGGVFRVGLALALALALVLKRSKTGRYREYR